MWKWIHKIGSPKYFYTFAGRVSCWLGWGCLIMLMAGLYQGLLVAPPDYQQGDSYRIMFVHVPAAWMSMFIYMVMAGNAAITLIWRIKITEVMLSASMVIGAMFTFITLITGSLWGKPMWGAWWVWDARLTSELILLFLYLGAMALEGAIEDTRVAARAVSILVLVGVVNIPIIHYSVEWWSTLHQPASISKLDTPSIHGSMLAPLLTMAVAFMLYYGWLLLTHARILLLKRERANPWVKEVIHG